MLNKIKYNLNRYFTLILIFFIIIGGISLGIKPIYREPDFLNPKLSAGPGSLSTDNYHSADWFENHIDGKKSIQADKSTNWVYRDYINQNIDASYAWKTFLPLTIDDEMIEELHLKEIDFIIVDSRITKTLSTYGFYFSINEKSSIFGKYKYGISIPLPTEAINKFDKNELFLKIYNNGNIKIINFH